MFLLTYVLEINTFEQLKCILEQIPNFDIEIIKEQVRSISTRNIIKIYAVLCFAMSLPVYDCYLC